MKKVGILVVVVAIIAMAGTAMAGFGAKIGGTTIGGAVEKGATKAVKGAVASSINKELEKKQYVCSWNIKSKNIEGCDLGTIASYLAGQKVAIETGGSAAGTYTNYDINVYAKDYKAYEKVKSELQKRGVGSWNITHEEGTGNEVKFSVNIQ